MRFTLQALPASLGIRLFAVALGTVALTQPMGAPKSINPGYRVLTYAHDSTALEGRLFPASGRSHSKAAILLFPDWMGVSDVSDLYARSWAKLGYTVLVADIYGQGIRPQNQDEAGKQASLYKSNRPLMRARALAALNALKAQGVDTTRIATLGYCFGGTCALELARAGAPVAGTISVHGGLDTPDSRDAAHIRGKVLVLHGADDPYVPAEQVGNFTAEMREAKVDWQLIQYGGAVHGFSNPKAPLDPKQGYAYHPVVAARAETAVRAFFDEVLVRK